MHPSSSAASQPEVDPSLSAATSPSTGKPSRAAWFAWGIAAVGYLLAIFHRMALGVAALDAEDRLAVGAGSIAALSVVGLTAYLSMQVPAGLISDRIGPRRGLAIGLVVIAAGEAIFAFSTALPLSLVGRAMVGAGDAFIFLNVLRIAAHWFPRERFASMTAATATIGALGQVVGTVPLNASLGGPGWSATFLGSSILTLGLALALFLFLRERPPGQVAPARHEHDPIRVSLRRSWARPTTRDGFWVHLTAMAPFVVVTGLWGAPILVDAQGMTRGQASAVLLVAVVVS
ncbi:MAG: MFS transporter, partial [Solirubrobacteraceae bacterium]|nr:MFS transporter [Solirubrobacteraceae bacterium]